jgi:polar amino acid transport system substrate-binding protein
MNRVKRVLICISAMLILATMLSACGSAKDENVLRVGIDDTYPPMEYKDDAGANAGFDIEVANALGEKLGMKVEFVTTAWTAIFSALDANKYDCIISSLSITEERKKTLSYTRPYISNSQVIVVKKDTQGISSEKDLGGKIVCVQMGTTSDESCKEFMKKTPFKDYKQYEKMTEALSELKIGRVDALVTDLVVAKYFVAKDPDSYTIVDTTLPKEPIGVAVKKANTDLSAKLDKALEDIMKDGTLKKISEKWFGEDMTSNIELN